MVRAASVVKLFSLRVGCGSPDCGSLGADDPQWEVFFTGCPTKAQVLANVPEEAAELVQLVKDADWPQASGEQSIYVAGRPIGTLVLTEREDMDVVLLPPRQNKPITTIAAKGGYQPKKPTTKSKPAPGSE